MQGVAGSFADRNIHIATVTIGTLIAPGSVEAEGVAEAFWQVAHDRSRGWEVIYPAKAA